MAQELHRAVNPENNEIVYTAWRTLNLKLVNDDFYVDSLE